MRRLKLLISDKMMSLFLLGVIILCSVAGISQHVSQSSNELSKTNCSSSCSPHGQHVAINNQSKNIDDDEIEPSPPSIIWNSPTSGLELLYLAPVGVALWILPRIKEIHLSTQMRF